jgi:hypothetical protein
VDPPFANRISRSFPTAAEVNGGLQQIDGATTG